MIVPQMEKPYQYTECGLDYVYLLDGVEVIETGHGPAIRVLDAGGLDSAIAKAVLDRVGLTGQEVRFIRGLLDMSQVKLARACGGDIEALEISSLTIPILVERAIRRLFTEKFQDCSARSRWSLARESEQSSGFPRTLYFSNVTETAP